MSEDCEDRHEVDDNNLDEWSKVAFVAIKYGNQRHDKEEIFAYHVHICKAKIERQQPPAYFVVSELLDEEPYHNCDADGTENTNKQSWADTKMSGTEIDDFA